MVLSSEPTRAEVEALAGPTVLEFGAPWCGHCQIVQPMVATAMAAHHGVRHVKIEDGKGQPLGRSFGVKLWPTLIFLNEGQEVERLVRPARLPTIHDAVERLQIAATVRAA